MPVTYGDSSIGKIGGTELRSIVSMNGQLYAANGYWRDSESNNPSLPGPQIFILRSATGAWDVDEPLPKSFDAVGAMQVVTFSRDSSGALLGHKQPVLLASVWDPNGSLPVYTKVGNAGTWSHVLLTPTAPAGSQIRSFGVHYDPAVNRDLVFGGTDPFGIFHGTYDPSVTTSISWGASAEPMDVTMQSQMRVMSFAEANGKLYATVGWHILERQDGPKPSWKTVFTWGNGLPLDGGGALRGLTAIANPSGPGQVLMTVAENPEDLVLRVDPQNGFRAITELDLKAYVGQALSTTVDGTLLAYNNMTPYGSAPCPSLLLGGFHARTPDSTNVFPGSNWHMGANFLIRDCHANYTSRAIVDRTIAPKPPLLAARTVSPTPFTTDDPPGTIYAGGFDAGGVTVHNTAWLYKGVPATPAESVTLDCLSIAGSCIDGTAATIPVGPHELVASATDSKGGALSYHWFVDGDEVVGNDAPTLDLSTTQLTAGRSYQIQVVARSTAGVTAATSATLNVVNDAVTIASLCPYSDPGCSTGVAIVRNLGAPVTLVVAASDAGNNALSYAWSRDGAAIGQNQPTLTLADTIAGTHAVSVTVTSSAGVSAVASTTVIVKASLTGE